MKIIAAKNIGFCFGVKRAISTAESAIKEKIKPVQFLGNLVHNENIIQKFLKKGVIFKKESKGIKSGTLIIQAHGSPSLPGNLTKKISIKNATCPLVEKVQKLAYSLAKQKYKIIIIGDKRHSEIKGIKGHLGKNKAIIIKNEKEAKKLPRLKKTALIAQTTQDIDNVKNILKILKGKNKKIKYFDTLCPEVQIRQRQTRAIIKKVEAILIIGSKLSANTGRLYQISKNSGKSAYWVNSLKELKKENIKNINTLGIVSGTSADNLEIKKIIKWLKQKNKN
jgi:(E)-4-hydroxy-3-methyl-but-2-enyl pyrophosphate reductase